MQPIKKKFMTRLIALQFVLAALAIILIFSLMPLVRAQGIRDDPAYVNMVVIGVILSLSIPVIAAAYVLKTAVAAAISALTERESTFSKALAFVAFGETLAIYGLIVAIMLMQQLPTL